MICDSRFESQIAIAVKSRDLEHLGPHNPSSARLSEESCLSEGSARVSQRALHGLSEGRSLRNDNKISRQSDLHFQTFIVVAFSTTPPQKSVLDDFPLCLDAPPLSKPQILSLLSSCRLWEGSAGSLWGFCGIFRGSDPMLVTLGNCWKTLGSPLPNHEVQVNFPGFFLLSAFAPREVTALGLLQQHKEN